MAVAALRARHLVLLSIRRGPKQSINAARSEAKRDLLAIGVIFHSGLLACVASRGYPIFELLAISWLTAAIAMSATTVLHHAGHGRFSRKAWLNAALTHLATPVGYHVQFWGLKHRIHHAVTASYPSDGYTSASLLLRLHPAAPYRSWHKYQAYYIWFGYSIYWLVDQLAQVRFLLTGSIPYSDRTCILRRWLLGWFYEKMATLTVLLPYILVGGRTILVALLVSGIAGSLIAGAIVGVGHINEGLEYPSTGQEMKNWQARVVAATASFSVDSHLVGWLTGGMTMHAAHHLKPIATRRELRQLHEDLRCDKTLSTLGVKPVEFATLGSALRGHVRVLKLWGRCGNA